MGIINNLLSRAAETKDNLYVKPLAMFNADFSLPDMRANNSGPKFPMDNSWQFSAVLGQPRQLNFREVRNFAASAWVQMVETTIKREISIIDWDLPNKDSKDQQTYDDLKKQVKDFFNYMNSEGEDFYDVMNPMISDVAEIDAGVAVKVFNESSYEIKNVRFVDAYGNDQGEGELKVLKPFGQRKLDEVRFTDGATILKQIDPHRRLLAYYQYSWKAPFGSPVAFEPAEIGYLQMNTRSYDLYGFAPLQSIVQVVELLMQSLRWNKDFFQNNAIPDMLAGLPNLNKEQIAAFQDDWNKIKGQPHKSVFINTPIEMHQLQKGSREMEWLDGQKWFMHLVFGVYGVSPVEAGFHENVNQGNQAGQERITVKNALKPYLVAFERFFNRNIIPEILQKPAKDIPFRFQFYPSDHVQETIEHDQAMKQLESGALTINEFRASQNLDPVEWGDIPYSMTQAQQAADSQKELAESMADRQNNTPTKTGDRVGDAPNADREEQDAIVRDQKMITVPYNKAFEVYMLGAH